MRQAHDSLKFKENLGAGPDDVKQLISMEETERGVKFADDAVEKLTTGKSWNFVFCLQDLEQMC